MAKSNIEKLAEVAPEPVVTVLEGGNVNVTARTQGAVFQANGSNVAAAARTILDALGVE